MLTGKQYYSIPAPVTDEQDAEIPIAGGQGMPASAFFDLAEEFSRLLVLSLHDLTNQHFPLHI